LALQASSIPSPAAPYLVLTYPHKIPAKTQATGHSGYPHKFPPATGHSGYIRTRLSGSDARKSSNWTLQLYPHKEFPSNWTLQSYPHKSRAAPSNWTIAQAKESPVKPRTPYSSSTSSVKKDI